MKTIAIPPQSEINGLLEQAREEDLIVRNSDGSEFMLVAVDDFDYEIARTRQNEKLMAFLNARASQVATISLEDVKRQLELSE